MKPAIVAILDQLDLTDFKISDAKLDAEIHERCYQPCFDPKFIGKRLRLNNRASQVITAQLALDHVLSRFISDQLINGATFNAERMRFPNKVDLLFSLGLLNPESAEWSKRLNTLRNKLAHDLTFKIPDFEAKQYIRFFQKYDEEPLLKGKQFGHALLLLILRVEDDRAKSLYFDVKRHLGILNARRLLNEHKSC